MLFVVCAVGQTRPPVALALVGAYLLRVSRLHFKDTHVIATITPLDNLSSQTPLASSARDCPMVITREGF
jgi:hypothetical protein